MIRKLTICTALGALALAAPAHASTLTAVGDSARWSDSLSNASAPHPAACTPLTCRSYDLDLALPPGAWDEPGGLLVSLRWPDEQLDAGYDLDLYLYGPEGTLVAKSDTLFYSSAEGLWLQSAANGRYRIVVAPRDVVGTSPFEVVAQAKRGWTVGTTSSLAGAGPLASGVTPYDSSLTFPGAPPEQTMEMLPDLVPVAPGNFRIESSLAWSYYGATARVPAHQPSCYPQETAGLTRDDPVEAERPLRCLRWNMTVRNVGRGPLELRVYPESETPSDAYQAIYRSDGTYGLRRVGDARFASAHGHVHFAQLEHVGLYTITPAGSPGTRVAEMGNKGFCAVDTDNPSFDTEADGPSRYRWPGTCDAENNRDPADPLYPGEPYFRMGISSGWADLYPWFIPDQYIDITDVPDGRYLVVYELNTADNVIEVTADNNEATACVEFHGTEASTCQAGP